MSVIKYINRIRHADFLIRTKATGDLKALSKKLHLSRSTTIEFLKEMKELGFPIKYCRKARNYYYEQHGKMIDTFFRQEGNDEKTG